MDAPVHSLPQWREDDLSVTPNGEEAFCWLIFGDNDWKLRLLVESTSGACAVDVFSSATPKAATVLARSVTIANIRRRVARVRVSAAARGVTVATFADAWLEFAFRLRRAG